MRFTYFLDACLRILLQRAMLNARRIPLARGKLQMKYLLPILPCPSLPCLALPCPALPLPTPPSPPPPSLPFPIGKKERLEQLKVEYSPPHPLPLLYEVW